MERLSFHLLALWFGLALCASAMARQGVEQLISDALAHSESGDFAEAHELLVKAIEQDPNSSVAHTRLGGVELLQSNYASGIKRFQQAIMLDSKNADAFIGMAVAYLHLGRHRLARETLKAAQQLDPASRQDIEQVLAWLDQRSEQNGH